MRNKITVDQAKKQRKDYLKNLEETITDTPNWDYIMAKVSENAAKMNGIIIIRGNMPDKIDNDSFYALIQALRKLGYHANNLGGVVPNSEIDIRWVWGDADAGTPD